jgi:hypothetical protein
MEIDIILTYVPYDLDIYPRLFLPEDVRLRVLGDLMS